MVLFSFFKMVFDNLMTGEISVTSDVKLLYSNWSIPLEITVMIFNLPVMLIRVKTRYNVSSRKDQNGSFLFLCN